MGENTQRTLSDREDNPLLQKMETREVTLSRIEAHVFRVPIDRPVETSFGRMMNRPAVFVRIEDAEGCFGWGEVFANWPAAGAEHRARLLAEDMSDLLLGLTCRAPSDLFYALDAATQIRALQCGEPGPFAHVIAGLDQALHDLCARQAGMPLHHYLDETASGAVPVYASGIHVRDGAAMRDAFRESGFRDVKVKVGFGLAEDVARVTELMKGARAGERLFADANQAWSIDEALEFVTRVGGLDLGWIEEPIRADSPAGDWIRLAENSDVALAAGENISGVKAVEAVLANGYLDVIQPDIAKWGGFTGGLAISRLAEAAGVTRSVHFLGGGIGLAASASYLSAIGGEGLLEFDVNENPLRDAFFEDWGLGSDGHFHLSEAPGLGIEAIPEQITRYETLALDCHA